MIGQFLKGYGEIDMSDEILKLDPDEFEQCGNKEYSELKFSLLEIYMNDVDTPCYVNPDDYYFNRPKYST